MNIRSSALSHAFKHAFSVAVILIGIATAGCSNPDREILAGLDEADQERFLRGRTAAGGCWVCHDLAGTVKKVGPSLLGVYGRRSGLATGYQGSPAMIGASIVWDDRSLAAFLMDPVGFVPGNRMVSAGIKNRDALADLLFYLRHVTRPGARTPETS
jgi:cytochrome c